MAGDASWAFSLPNTNVPVGQALQGLVEDKKQQEKINYQNQVEAQRLQQKQLQENRQFNLNTIDKATALDKLMVGEQKVDDYVLQSVNSLKQNALSNYINLDPAIAKQMIERDMGNIVRWQTAAKNQYGQLKESVGNVIKTGTNINPDLATKLALKTFDDNFFQLDEQGNANPVIPQKPIDYNSLFSNPRVMAGITTDDITPLTKWAHGIDKEEVGGSDFVDRKGNKKSYGWSGVQTRFSQPVMDNEGKVVGFEAKSVPFNSMTDANGKPLKLATPEMMDEVLSTPGVNNTMFKLWEKYKESHNMGELDAPTEDILFRNFVWKTVNNLLPHGVKIKETEATPKDSVSINFYIGGSQAQPFNSETTEVALDRIGEKPIVSVKGATLKNGEVTNKNGEAFEGVFTIKPEQLPAGVLKLITPYLTDDQKLADNFDLDIKDGKIQGIRGGSDGNWITRQDIYNAQLKDNSEPQKQAAQPKYAPSSGAVTPKAKTAKTKSTPTYKGLDKDGNPIYE